MICPYCHHKTSRMIIETENGREIRCSYCGALLQKEELEKKEQPTLRCPRCGHYCRSDYCPVCGYQFKEGRDY